MADNADAGQEVGRGRGGGGAIRFPGGMSAERGQNHVQVCAGRLGSRQLRGLRGASKITQYK